MYIGGCLCGAIRIEIVSKITDIFYCHCSQCRKAQGSTFAVNGNVNKNDFIIISGEDALSGYPFNEEETKFFCKYCGSPIMSKNITKPDRVRVRLGIIESNIVERPIAHVYTASKANWETITDNLPKHPVYCEIE